MDFNRPLRRPGSSRPSSRFNPITGEELGSDRKSEDRGSPSCSVASDEAVHRRTVVPALNLGNLLDDDEASRRPLSLALQPHSSARSFGEASSRPLSAVKNDRVENLVQLKSEVASHSAKSKTREPSHPPYALIPNVKKLNAEEVDEEKRREKVIETVLLDQLSRAVISQPEQEEKRSTAAAFGDLYHQPGMPRGHIRKLHESKILARASPTEMLLSQRVRFGARVLTRVSQDTLRELTGFFFASDNSLTIYEYKQFGKSGKALPFIAKGTYVHPCGRRKGKPVTLADIAVGKTIVFNTAHQPALPITLQEESSLLVRITEVDEEAKQRIVFDGVRNSDKEAVWSSFHRMTDEEQYDMAVIQRLRSKVQSFIKKRSMKAITGLAAQFRNRERPGGTVSKAELVAVLDDFHISLTAEEFDDFWNAIDVDANGMVTIHEALRGILGQMSERRNVLVRKAFQKLDTGKQGIVPVSQLMKFFCAAKHPHVSSGATSAVLLSESFLSHWNESTAVRGMVSFSEFEDYYEGLSAITENDQEFEDVLRSSWGL